jgi:hypothetical protein
MVMVEYPAHTTARALGNFACSLGRAHAYVLAGDGCTFSNIAGGVQRVQRNQIARTFPHTLGRCSSAFGSPFANVSGTAADVAARASLLRLSSRLGCFGGLRRGLGISVLGTGVLAAEGKG